MDDMEKQPWENNSSDSKPEQNPAPSEQPSQGNEEVSGTETPSYEDTGSADSKEAPQQPSQSEAPAAEPEQPSQAEVPSAEPEQPSQEETPSAEPEQPSQAEAPSAESEQPSQEEAPAADPEQPSQEEAPSSEPEQPSQEEAPPAEPEQPSQEEAPSAESEQPTQEGNPYAGGQQSPQAGYPYGGQYQNPQAGYPYSGQQQAPQGGPACQDSGRQNPYYNKFDNPYAPPQGQQPYGNYYGQPMQQPPHNKMGIGLKVFLWILGAVAVVLLAALIFFSVNLSNSQKNSSSSLPSGSSSGIEGTLPKNPDSSGSSSEIIGGVQGDGTDQNSAGIKIQKKPSGPEFSAKDVYKKVIQSVVGVETTTTGTTEEEGETGVGTGIVATSDGYILTNAHVVDYSRGNSVKVILHNNKEYKATVVGFDKSSDLAVLKINATGLSPATFGNADDYEIGDHVLAIGNPGGLNYAGSLTGGMISALNRTIESHSDNGMTYIQTDAAINPGNSGGPLVNMYAQVIGINSNKIAATGFEGMGFAIPVSKAQPIINQLIQHGYVTGRCRLGITAQTAGTQSGLFSTAQGVVIRRIDSDSDMSGKAEVGDIILEAGGEKIASLDDLYAMLNSHKPGDTISMKIYTTSGSTKTIQVKLLEDKGETQK